MFFHIYYHIYIKIFASALPIPLIFGLFQQLCEHISYLQDQVHKGMCHVYGNVWKKMDYAVYRLYSCIKIGNLQ